MKLTTSQKGFRQFEHTLHDNIAIARAVHCPWLPRERIRTLQHPTVTRNWDCGVLINGEQVSLLNPWRFTGQGYYNYTV
ncbi:hypothetical protein ACQQ16_000187 [Enterobacter hormaechei]